ncbi:MAG TPA: hypothetical protein PLW79_05115 [Caldisericia bacterium]|nr:hypothetical protein [Caldisericia bacterium]
MLISKTSLSLCVIKITDFPSLTRFLNRLKRSSTSFGVNTDVGSSRIIKDAPPKSILIISTLCCSPRESS